MKVAVVGAGLFGVTISASLAKDGRYNVHLFEASDQVLSGASQANQLRLHRGYHYPRGERTVRELLSSIEKFEKTYSNAIDRSYQHYYAIASNKSLISAQEFIHFCDVHDLEYDVVTKENHLPIRRNAVDLIIRAQEYLINYGRLKEECEGLLARSHVKGHFSRRFTIEDIGNFDLVVNCTYSSINELIAPERQTNYQFEVCEKIILDPPKRLRGRSIVILDGPFMCIDPWAGSEYSLLGNVVHAIHSTNVGKLPEVPEEVRPFLNKGPVDARHITKFDTFIRSSCQFFEGIEDSKYVSSMFTIRTVLPNLDETDDRPTCVFQAGDNILNVFAGKLDTCVLAYERVSELLDQRF